jgi:predicted site-specific integrase-resolvase
MAKKKPKRNTTLAQASVMMGVDRKTIARWCRSGAPHDQVACPTTPAGFMFYCDVAEMRAWRASKPEGNRTAFIDYAAVDGDEV